MKAIIVQVAGVTDGVNQSLVNMSLYNGTDYIGDQSTLFDFVGIDNSDDYRAAVITAILAYSDAHSLGLSESDIIWSSVPALPVQAQATHSITTSTGASGFQISSTRDADVSYNVTIAATATIGGNSSGTVVLEIATTNSATAGDWKEVARFTNGQAITLAIALQSVQTMAGTLSGFVPRGYYAKLRSINNAGTPTYTYNSGQEVLK